MPSRIGDPSRRRRHFIREWRKFRHLSQQKLAELIGGETTKSSVSRIENLKTGYTQDFLEACADALGTHPATLLSHGPTDADKVHYGKAIPPQAHNDEQRTRASRWK